MRCAARSIVTTVLLGTAVAACDAGPDSPTAISVDEQTGQWAAARTRDAAPRADAADALLAALGDATLTCLGTVSPFAYVIADGFLVRAFDACTRRDDAALEQIDALLGVQHSEFGREDGLADLYVARWARASARTDAGDCPQWLLLERINLPSAETIRLMGSRPSVQKSYARYAVRSADGEAGRAVVERAAVCAGGFGDAFVVRTDARASEVLVDPTWWLLNDDYDRDENPFLTPGYYHPMSYYGRLPGDRYGAIRRAGEQCSRYDEVTHKHYIHYLNPIQCTPGWYCMSYCM